jgi:membrane protein
MGSLWGRLRRSGLGRFSAKFNADLASYGAMLIAWQSLFSLFPLIAGLLAIFGLVLDDPEQRRSLAESFASQFPSQVTDLLSFMEETRELGGLLGIASGVGLIWSGFWLFDTMAFVFNRFYGVPSRGYRGQLIMALTMMAVYVALIAVSLLATGISAFLVGISERSVPAGVSTFLERIVEGILPIEAPRPAAVIGWLVSLGSAILMFLAVYRVVPNTPLTLADVWPGAAVAGVLFLLLNQAFPLYFRFLGGGYVAYKTLGLFLLLMTWFYCLALILVVGAELNAFLGGRGSTPDTASSAPAEPVAAQRAS